MSERIKQLEMEINKLSEILKAKNLLSDIFIDRWRYAKAINNKTLNRLRYHFIFDDCE